MEAVQAQGVAYAAVSKQADKIVVNFSGDWLREVTLPSREDLLAKCFEYGPVQEVALTSSQLGKWDSSFVSFALQFLFALRAKQYQVSYDHLHQGVRRLLDLASAVPKAETEKAENQRSLLAHVGQQTIYLWSLCVELIRFVGELSSAAFNVLRGKGKCPWADLPLLIEDCGAKALPIVTLISLLVGLILAFIASVQLEQFGAQLYVANLVGLAMAREMGAIMASIIMAGRTGAAFAAQLGTMQANEEIDALQTLGISAMEFLVLPRVIALTIMLPFLCLYANLMGVVGGAIVSVSMFDISFLQYIEQTKAAVPLKDVFIGVSKSAVFGLLVAIIGCQRGIIAGRSASSVGKAVTSAVVTSIVFIIVADAVFAIICSMLNI